MHHGLFQKSSEGPWKLQVQYFNYKAACCIVCYTAVFSVVTQRVSGEERCVTTQKRLCSRLPAVRLFS